MQKMVVMIAGVGHRWVNLLVLGVGESVLVLGKLGGRSVGEKCIWWCTLNLLVLGAGESVLTKSWSWLYMIIRGFEEKMRKMLKMVVMIAGVGDRWVNLLVLGAVLGAGESVLVLGKLGGRSVGEKCIWWCTLNLLVLGAGESVLVLGKLGGRSVGEKCIWWCTLNLLVLGAGESVLVLGKLGGGIAGVGESVLVLGKLGEGREECKGKVYLVVYVEFASSEIGESVLVLGKFGGRSVGEKCILWCTLNLLVLETKSWYWLYMIIRGFEEKVRKMLKMVVMIASVGHRWVNLLMLGAW
uniref:Uncharacterized protein n=1 Tax=Fagus sylvatica TaxID=28930 RepID=A0A2N9ED93_FAGSY